MSTLRERLQRLQQQSGARRTATENTDAVVPAPVAHAGATQIEQLRRLLARRELRPTAAPAYASAAPAC